jgi:hypothetical protein
VPFLGTSAEVKLKTLRNQSMVEAAGIENAAAIDK